MNIYEKCPILEDDRFIIRLIEKKDAEDLLKVYSDPFSLPYFNSDNCHGSNFYITTKEDMDNTIKYWLLEYWENKFFVRFSIVDKTRDKVIGTIEMFKRKANDFFNDCGLLRVDVGSSDETTEILNDIFSLTTEPFKEWFSCERIATKAPIYAIHRIDALKQNKYMKSEEPLIGHDDTRYYDYWIK